MYFLARLVFYILIDYKLIEVNLVYRLMSIYTILLCGPKKIMKRNYLDYFHLEGRQLNISYAIFVNYANKKSVFFVFFIFFNF